MYFFIYNKNYVCQLLICTHNCTIVNFIYNEKSYNYIHLQESITIQCEYVGYYILFRILKRSTERSQRILYNYIVLKESAVKSQKI